jgi:hypothetical protein
LAQAIEPSEGGHGLDIDPFHALSEGNFWFWDGTLRQFAEVYYDWPLIVVIIGVAFALFGRKEKTLQVAVAVLVISACLNLVYMFTPWIAFAIKRPDIFWRENVQLMPVALVSAALGTLIVPVLAGGLGYGLGLLVKRVLPSRPA